MTRGQSGADALAAWLARRAEGSARARSVEDALLARRFAAYATRRLSGFALMRAWGTALHLVELTLLASVFSERPLVASLAFQNGALVVEAAAWGATEALRRRLRELGPGSAAAELLRAWLTRVTWVALACVLAPLAHGAWLASSHRGAGTPGVLVGYGIAVGLRLALDLLLRTYYSGVFAHGRVHRPLATFFVGPLVLLAVTWGGWGFLGPWSFPLAIVLSTVVSRALAFRYVSRAYRVTRTPSPSLGLQLWPRRHAVRGASGADVVLGGLASTTSRLGSVVLLAAAVPSLAAAGDDEELQALALALHLAAPLFAAASQWGSVFYHDWKRLEDEAAALLARALAWRLVVVALVVGALSYGALVLLVTRFVAWDAAEPTLLALAPATLGAAVWASLQIRGFSQGAFVDQAAGASAMILVVWLALSAQVLGEDAWSWAIGAGPWIAVLAHVLLGLVPRFRARAGAPLPTLPLFLRALARERGDVVVREARLVSRPGALAVRVARALEDHGGARGGTCVRLGARLLWFERAPGEGRGVWLARSAGLLADLRELGRGPGASLVALLAARRPAREAEVMAALRQEFARVFPDGFVVELGAPPPPVFLALAPAVQKALWRDALREVSGRRRPRSGFGVVVWAPEGAVRAIFAAPRPLAPEAARRFRAAVEEAGWRRVVPVGPAHDPPSARSNVA